jgi:hypothetical protein
MALLTGICIVQGQYMAPRVTNLALQYITTGVALGSSWKTMKPHMGSLLANVVFPLCCFDDEDEELWEEDPQEYIRKVSIPVAVLAQVITNIMTAVYRTLLCILLASCNRGCGLL